MRMQLFVATTAALMGTVTHAQTSGGTTAPLPQLQAPAIAGVVAAGTKVELIKDGFKGSDSPIALPDGDVLFVEMNGNKVIRIDKTGQTSVFIDDALSSRAITMDREGRVLGIQTAGQQVGVIYPKGSEKLVLKEVDGAALGGPNDLIADRKGGVYVTDPGPYTLPPGAPAFPSGVIYVPSAGAPRKVARDIEFPNGLVFSPDEKTLFVNNAKGEGILSFDVQPNGDLTGRRTVGRYTYDPAIRKDFPYIGDGLTVDSENRLYVAIPPGVQVFSAKGELLGTIPVPRPPQNLAFGGADRKTLYIVGRGAAFKVQMLSQGVQGRPK